MKNEIMKTANRLYAQNGINSVSLQQIAVEMGVPKEAVSVQFDNLEQLLVESLIQKIGRTETIMIETMQKAQSPIESLLFISVEMFNTFSYFGSTFYKDILEYPVAKEYLLVFKNRFISKCSTCFRKSMEEDYFISGSDKDYVVSVFIEQMRNVCLEYQPVTALALLRYIATEKGIRELDRLSPVLNQQFEMPDISNSAMVC